MMMRNLWYRDTYRDTWVAIRYAYRWPNYRDASMYHYDPSREEVWEGGRAREGEQARGSGRGGGGEGEGERNTFCTYTVR